MYTNANFKIPKCLCLHKINALKISFLILRILVLFSREVFKFLKTYANFYLILFFLNVCEQTFHIPHVRVSQDVKGVLMGNLQHIIFKSRGTYWQIFKSALVYL